MLTGPDGRLDECISAGPSNDGVQLVLYRGHGGMTNLRFHGLADPTGGPATIEAQFQPNNNRIRKIELQHAPNGELVAPPVMASYLPVLMRNAETADFTVAGRKISLRITGVYDEMVQVFGCAELQMNKEPEKALFDSMVAEDKELGAQLSRPQGPAPINLWGYHPLWVVARDPRAIVGKIPVWGGMESDAATTPIDSTIARMLSEARCTETGRTGGRSPSGLEIVRVKATCMLNNRDSATGRFALIAAARRLVIFHIGSQDDQVASFDEGVLRHALAYVDTRWGE